MRVIEKKDILGEQLLGFWNFFDFLKIWGLNLGPFGL
jgi:hypothetical protein